MGVQKKYCLLPFARLLFGAFLIAQLVKNPPVVHETPVRFLGQKDPLEGIGYTLQYSWASLVTQLVKNLPAMWETWVLSLGWEDPLEKEMATQSSILAWRTHMNRGACWAAVHGIFQARVPEWVAISFSKGSPQPKDKTQVSHIAGRCFIL